MTKEEYEEWRHNPLTIKFHQFLRDKRLELLEGWAEGVYDLPSTEQSIRENSAAMARAQCLLELAELPDDYVSGFYRQSTKGSTDVHEN